MKKKCIEKRAYGLKAKALDVAKKMYLRDGTKTAIYECDVCLDFHLTTKRCNTASYHEKWKKEGLKLPKPKKSKKSKKVPKLVIRNYEEERQKKLKKIYRREISKMYNEFLKLERELCAKYGLPCPYNYKITGTKKENTLPLAEQKRLLQNL